MRISRSVLALGAVVFAAVLAVPAAASARPTQPLSANPLGPSLVQRLLLKHNQSGPQTAIPSSLPQGQFQLPTQQLGSGPKPKAKDPYNALFLSTDFGFSVEFYNLNGGVSVKPWIQLNGGPFLGDAVDENHTLYAADESGGDVIVPRGNLNNIGLLGCFCYAFDTKIDHKGNVYISHLDGLFFGGTNDTIYEFAHGTLNYVQTIYDPNMIAPLYIAFDSKDDLVTAGINHAGNWEIDVFPAGSSKPKRLQQFSEPEYGEFTLAIDRYDNLLVGDFLAGTIKTYAPPWTHPAIASISPGPNNAMVMTNDHPQNIWVASAYFYSQAVEYSLSGSVVDYTAYGYPYLPAGIAVDPVAH